MQVFNGFLFVLGAAMGVVLAVVCVLYAVHLDTEPRLGAELPLLIAFTGAFALLAASGAFAFAGHRRQARWRWLAQVLPAAPAAALAALLLQLKT